MNRQLGLQCFSTNKSKQTNLMGEYYSEPLQGKWQENNHHAARALLKYLMVDMGLGPGHPLVTLYESQLFMNTADREYKVALEMNPGYDPRDLLEACYVGCPLWHSPGPEHTLAVATSLEYDYETTQ